MVSILHIDAVGECLFLNHFTFCSSFSYGKVSSTVFIFEEKYHFFSVEDRAKELCIFLW